MLPKAPHQSPNECYDFIIWWVLLPIATQFASDRRHSSWARQTCWVKGAVISLWMKLQVQMDTLAINYNWLDYWFDWLDNWFNWLAIWFSWLAICFDWLDNCFDWWENWIWLIWFIGVLNQWTFDWLDLACLVLPVIEHTMTFRNTQLLVNGIFSLWQQLVVGELFPKKFNELNWPWCMVSSMQDKCLASKKQNPIWMLSHWNRNCTRWSEAWKE